MERINFKNEISVNMNVKSKTAGFCLHGLFYAFTYHNNFLTKINFSKCSSQFSLSHKSSA
jgi:hypothetical protein